MAQKRDSQYQRDLSRYNFVSRKVFDRKCDQYDRKIADLKQRFREHQVLVTAIAAALPGRAEEE